MYVCLYIYEIAEEMSRRFVFRGKKKRENLWSTRRIVSKVRKIFVVEDWFCTPSVSR